MRDLENPAGKENRRGPGDHKGEGERLTKEEWKRKWQR